MMSTSRLLRVSDFCREKTPRKLPVTVEIISSAPRRRRRIPCQIVDAQATVYVTAELLVALSLQVGDIAWLQSSSSSLIKGVPVILLVDEESDRDPSRDLVVRVPPTIASSIGARCIGNNNSCFIKSYNKILEEADTVKVRPLGRPVPRSWNDIPETVVPNLSSDSTRLLGQSSLISAWDDSRGLFVFEVMDIESKQEHLEAALATNKTKWTLEAISVDQAVRRLPPLSLESSFHASTTSRPQSEEKSTERKECGVKEQPPHPSISEMKNALSLPANAPAAQRIIHVEGTQENHVDVCIQAAADSLGMRYLCIRGLAAHAHASDIPVSTGSQADQLAGCKATLRHAQECAPCVLHLCDMDHEWSREDEPLRQMQQQRLWTVLMDSLSAGDDTDGRCDSAYVPCVIVVLSTTKPLSAGPLLHNLIFESIVIHPPNEKYARYLWNDDCTFEEIFSLHLEGRSARDVAHLRRYWSRCASSSDKMKSFELFCKQMDVKQRKSTPHIPSVHWQDVGGLAHVRSEIMDAIELPLKHPRLFPNGGRNGVLLYGPPGTGKTLIAKAVATECGLPFLSVKGPELLGSYVGESEANVRATFAAARKAATQGRTRGASILFFDELDSLAPRRGDAGDNGGVMDRVVAMLLTELDGSPSSDAVVFVIGATNRPDLLDPSLLRPGRLDRLVYLGMATKTQDRAQILAALMRKFRIEMPDPVELALQVVNQLPPNLTGADFSAIASGALRLSLERICNQAEEELKRRQTVESQLTLGNVLDEWDESQLIPVVTSNDLFQASKDVVPSVSAMQLADYERLRVQFSSSQQY